MKRYVIDSVADICDFFADLNRRTRLPFYPEDDLALVTDVNGVAVFSPAEIAYFDDVILDCFVYCNDHHLDLHELVEEMREYIVMHQPLQKIAMRKLPTEPFLKVQGAPSKCGHDVTNQKSYASGCKPA